MLIKFRIIFGGKVRQSSNGERVNRDLRFVPRDRLTAAFVGPRPWVTFVTVVVAVRLYAKRAGTVRQKPCRK